MSAHPWKAEDLSVKTRDAPEGACHYYTQAEDDYWLEENDQWKDLCKFCFQPDTYSAHCCRCEEWDDDCWIGPERPWLNSADMVELSEKGEAMRHECCCAYLQAGLDICERYKIRKARQHWMVLKDAVDAMRVALYWQEQTQQSLCAPEGAGRAADAAAFQAEF